MIEFVRIIATVTGAIVWLMWFAGILDLADFTLIFRVAP